MTLVISIRSDNLTVTPAGKGRGSVARSRGLVPLVGSILNPASESIRGSNPQPAIP